MGSLLPRFPWLVNASVRRAVFYPQFAQAGAPVADAQQSEWKAACVIARGDMRGENSNSVLRCSIWARQPIKRRAGAQLPPGFPQLSLVIWVT